MVLPRDPERTVRVVADISHHIRDGMAAYPGLPPARVSLHLDHATSRDRYDGQAEFAIGRIDLVGNVGTYLDAPYHRFPDGPDIADLPLERLIDLPTTVVDARQHVAVNRRIDLMLPLETLAGRAVLVRTGWSRRWGTDAYWAPGPYLGAMLIDQLIHHRPAVVGVDFANIDDTNDLSRPAHTRLLGEQIVIVEHLCELHRIPPSAHASFVPLAVVGAPSLPIRAYATWQEPRDRSPTHPSSPPPT